MYTHFAPFVHLSPQIKWGDYCGQLWVWHIVCGQTCDGLYHFTFCLITFGIPIGSLVIKSALARHTGVRRVFGSRQGDHVISFGQSASLLRNCSAKGGNRHFGSLWKNLCQSILAPIISNLTGVHGLCFGYFVSGPLLYVPWYLVHFQWSISGSP